MRSEVWQADHWPLGRLKEADSRLTQFVHNSKTYTEGQPGWDAAFSQRVTWAATNNQQVAQLQLPQIRQAMAITMLQHRLTKVW